MTTILRLCLAGAVLAVAPNVLAGAAESRQFWLGGVDPVELGKAGASACYFQVLPFEGK
ncbi:MAG TPA: hypothetical protein VK794_11170 [Steroidobacteraceae bacterium]|jgi:hypothetical protein|nr:hypothetical protein [Steroidobacteraceae bacterium]